MTDFKNYTLTEFISKIKATDNTEKLAKLETEIFSEFQDRKSKGGTWIQKQETATLLKNCQSILADHRRFLLSVPAFRKSESEYHLGRAIAAKK